MVLAVNSKQIAKLDFSFIVPWKDKMNNLVRDIQHRLGCSSSLHLWLAWVWSRKIRSKTWNKLARRFGVTVNFVTFIQFSSQYILPLLNTFGVTVNCVTVIQFSSQYILLLFNTFGVTVNCVTVIQLISQYILLSLNIAQHIWCYSDLCDCYSVQFSIHTAIAQNFSTHLVLQWIVWLLFSSFLNTYCYCSTFLNTFGVTVNCVTVIEFSSHYILLLLNWFGVAVNYVTVIKFSSQYALLLLNSFDFTLNSATFIQFSFTSFTKAVKFIHDMTQCLDLFISICGLFEQSFRFRISSKKK